MMNTMLPKLPTIPNLLPKLPAVPFARMQGAFGRGQGFQATLPRLPKPYGDA